MTTIEQQKQQTASISQRLQQLNAIWHLAKGLKLQLKMKTKDRELINFPIYWLQIQL